MWMMKQVLYILFGYEFITVWGRGANCPVGPLPPVGGIVGSYQQLDFMVP